MGLKYFARYRDINQTVKEIRFFKDDFSGEPTEWFCTNGAVEYNFGSSDTSFFPEQPIIAGQARISLWLTEHYDLKDFTTNRKTYFVQIVDVWVENVEFSGWVEPWDAARPYKKAPWPVSLTVSCGLAHLSKTKYKSPDTVFKKTGLTIIQECLNLIQAGDLPLRLSTHIVETSFSGPDVLGLTSYEQSIFRFFDSNGEAMYCDVIVNDILNHFNGEIVQIDNCWVIRGIVDNSTGLANNHHDIGDVTGKAWPSTYEVNSLQSFTEDGGVVRILPAKNKYRTEVDLGAQTPFFENGNMIIWTENGLVGWDFTHMAKGNPGWEQYSLGGESGRSILKINGKSPQPYRKRKKVGLFKKLTNQAINIAIAGTGAVGALFNKPVLKGAWYDVEPSEWIESPGGSISRADRSVTISFDYETEAFSSDILISIRIPVTLTDGSVRNFWVDKNSNPAQAGSDKTNWSADTNFHLIRVQPVDRGSLVNKGEINVSTNPDYPAASAANWTWAVTGVPAGEYRKIGGANGVNVENGDLIIARIANAGGTQEGVGENFEVISIRNNTKKGTFSGTVALSSTFITTSPDVPYPDKVYVRFYKMADDEGKPGDWYKVYNLNGVLEGFVPSEESARYATTLERGDVTDEEATKINLISGDYTKYYVGAWTKPGSNEVTKSWKRRGNLNESISIYRAMMKDRLCMTTRPLTLIEGTIKLMPEALRLTYMHTLMFGDQGDKKFRILSFKYNDYMRTARIVAAEVRFENIPDSELKQNSYIPGSGKQLNTVPDQGDGIYPSKEDTTTGRLNAEDMPLTGEEILEAVQAVGRTGALFEDITPLTYVAGIESEDSIDLHDFISEAFTEYEEDLDAEDKTDFSTLIFKVVSKPTWISAIDVENLVVTATALAPKSGSFFVDFEAYDPTDPENAIPIRVPVLVEENEDYVETWPPEFEPFPVLNFALNKETVTGFNFRDYMPDGHKFLTYRFFSVPEWVTARSVVNDDFSITGTPIIIERRTITVQIWDGVAEHRPYTDEITLQVIEATEITGELMDTSAGDAKIGDLPGAFEVLAQWDTPITVKGLHDRVLIKITGGGDLGAELDVTKNFPLSSPVAEGIYRPFADTSGTTASVGQYLIEVTAFLGENETDQPFDLTLYDEEYLAKMKKFLVKGFDYVGEIMPDGATSFVYPGPVNARAEIHDIDYDEIYLSLEKDGEVIGEQHITDVNPTLAWWFEVFEENTELEAGVYTFPVRLLKDGVEVFKRTDKFTIESKDAEPKPLLSLATFPPGTTNATIIAENIPLKGAEYDLVPWTLVFNSFGPGVECVTGEWELQFLRGGSFAEMDLEQFTGYPQKFAYTSGKTLIFGNKSSLKIGDIHQAPSRVLAKFIGRDADGKIVGIAQADFSFRVALDPEDYSGLRFLTIDHVNGGEMTLLDANVPKTGRQYFMPPEGFWWTISGRRFGGEEFDAVKVMLSKIVGGIEQPAWVLGPDYIVYHNVGSVVTELTDDDKAYIFGMDTDADGIRVVFRVGDDVEMPLDGTAGLGFWKITMIAYLATVEVATLSATIELIEDVEPPIKDCCACDCEGEASEQLEFPFNTPAEEWIVTHNLNKKPDPNILVGGMKVMSDVQYIDNDVFKIIHTKPETGLVIITK
ncbi:hypothetical protein J2Y45_002117 [Dyadobacter sp. BE34]|uniref:Tip attachment protein J domain-containing protein n=1 Tax=Dyadobacter fermentans TaxID=94254 RepID=A0ABU1QWN6_9BACT|nr:MULTISPECIES: hypothetical protein [Dyadobacter]MDR6805574.1 hypothetical protein [Dyadobacter fermentans]MDR7042666.1 hypothetical protein [Dyadobacter sp. BE242]MDR7196978.1 hypothetical protein [Dyadobacter sp. BE34]MDR7215587.1 hypothetical protein [Dyadobacter sp. BE31]MDR7263123.1 hypothetical protein [Dyadobacter sp. BE32]